MLRGPVYIEWYFDALYELKYYRNPLYAASVQAA